MRFKPVLAVSIVVLIFFIAVSSAAGLDWGSLWGPAKPDQAKIAAGLKEALRVGAENSVKQTGRLDGFYKNPKIKIILPEQLQKSEKLLRKVGLGKQVDQFVLSMNRAAEKAVPAARDIFGNAIKEITFDDAIKIFKGNDTAATDYFRNKTSERLSAAFLPAVSKATDEVGTTRLYKKIAAEARKVSIVKLEPVDIDRYVVAKSLDGLFYTLGEEEKKIRKDPAARITQLLKEVFGK